MQDVQNIPNPDVNSYEGEEDDFNTHSEESDVESPAESIPPPPGSVPNIPVEEPPETHEPPIDEPNNAPMRIV